MKNKIYIRLTYWAICLLSVVTIFTACNNETVNMTPTLSVFGPSPVLRGGQIKFVGTNLDKITSIILPNNIEVKDITKTSATEISITIPQDAMPGIVTLKSAAGDIVTKTPLTFSEPISISSFSPAIVKAGDVFTINGDYLNLIAKVTFSEGIAVDSAQFISKSRKQITVKVPDEARTGKVLVSTGAEIPVQVYTDSPVTVTLPAITGLTPNPVKPGMAVQISGTNLQLVKSLVFYNGSDAGLIVNSFTVNTANTIITATVPKTVKEGKVKLFAKSGVIVESPSDLTLVGPVITSISPNPVKSGATLTVTGTDLDLVTGASFSGVTATLGTQTATTLELTVPLTATNGTLQLATSSGKMAESSVISYVKPTITSVSPLSLTAGENITISGTDLDLVRKVTFVGGLSANVTPTSATSLVVTVPVACVGTDVITLTTSNGTNVASTDKLTIVASTTPAITSITPAVAPGGLMTITGKNLNNVESIYFENNVKAVLYGVRSESSIQVYVPETAKHGSTTFTLNSFDGKQIVSPSFIYGTDPILSTTVIISNFDGGGNSQSTWGSSFTFGMPAVNLDGTAAMIGKAGITTSWDWLWAANWGAIPALPNPEKYVIKMDVCITKPVTGTTMGMCLKGWDISVNLGDVFGTTTNGQWVTMTFDVLNSSMVIDGTKDWGLYISGANSTYDFSGIMIDNLRFDLKSSPSTAPKFKLIGF